MRQDSELKEQLSALGAATEYKQDYAPEVLEAFDNKHPMNKLMPNHRTTRLCRNQN